MHKRRILLLLGEAATLLLAGQIAIAPAAAIQTVTVAPASPTVGNCYPFGEGDTGSFSWPPFMGFIYQNVPAFQLKTGDMISFDTGVVNNAYVQLQIDLAATTSNGGTSPDLPFTTVVTNTQTPTNPTGDTTVGNFEMHFTAQAPFNFGGGGLIIRFSNPSTSYQADSGCTGNLVGASSSDSSGTFVERFFRDADGVPPYDFSGTSDIGGFQLTLADVPMNVPTGQRAAALKRCKKRAHKRHWSHHRLKKCNKKANLLPV